MAAAAVNYLVTQAVNNIEMGEYAFAKCYLLTAAEIQPDNLDIKNWSFSIGLREGNIEDAARHFGEMFCNSTTKKDQSKEWHECFEREMKTLLRVSSDRWRRCMPVDRFQSLFAEPTSSNPTDHIYRELFTKIKPEHLISCLTRFCDLHSAEIGLTIDLHYFMITKFPDQDVTSSAIRLIELKRKMSERGNVETFQFLRNSYLSDILPVLFSNPRVIDAGDNVAEKYFFSALQYFLEDFLDDQNESFDSASQATRRQSLEAKLEEIINQISEKHKWTLFKDTVFSVEHLNTTFDAINCFVDSRLRNDDGSMNLSSKQSSSDPQVFYPTLALFVVCLCRYQANLGLCCLCEKTTGVAEQRAPSHMILKKRKLINYVPTLVAANPSLVEQFYLICKLYKLLESFMSDDFASFISATALASCRRFTQFRLDYSLYNGDFNKALECLASLATPIAANTFAAHLQQLHYFLQSTVIHLKLGQMPNVAQLVYKTYDLLHTQTSSGSQRANVAFGKQLGQLESVLRRKQPEAGELPYSIESLVQQPDNTVENGLSYCDLSVTPIGESSRTLIFLHPSLENVMALLIDTMITLFWTLPPNDLILGHLLVLSQYQWPYYYTTCQKVLNLISSRQSTNPNKPVFSYPHFQLYIHQLHILEELSAFVNDDLLIELAPHSALPPDALRESTKQILFNQVTNSVNMIPVEHFLGFFKDVRPLLDAQRIPEA